MLKHLVTNACSPGRDSTHRCSNFCSLNSFGFTCTCAQRALHKARRKHIHAARFASGEKLAEKDCHRQASFYSEGRGVESPKALRGPCGRTIQCLGRAQKMMSKIMCCDSHQRTRVKPHEYRGNFRTVVVRRSHFRYVDEPS